MRLDDPNQTSTLKYLHESGCTWEVNPPHVSHMGGVWEHMIGVTRGILDFMLLRTKHTRLTHDVLCTLMAEVCAIINARPLVPVSSDSSSPMLLTSAVLLTQKPGESPPHGSFEEKDLFKCQWRQVHLQMSFGVDGEMNTSIPFSRGLSGTQHVATWKLETLCYLN